MIYNIFGVNVKINLCNSLYKEILLAELTPYKCNDTNFLIEINDKSFEDDSKIITSKNPSIHTEFENGFKINNLLIDVYFGFDDDQLNIVQFKLNYSSSTIKRYLRKFANKQFSNRVENIGQIFHENILVPMMFFIPNRSIIHSSAVKFNNKTFLFGGTGGVGKTSIELELCQNKNGTFIADDISVINEKTEVYPNLNYPKIYAYNVHGNSELEKIILDNTSIINRLHWSLKQRFFGPSSVRRRLSPFNLYKNTSTDKNSLDNYLILLKTNVNSLQSKELSVNSATEATIKIMHTEYAYLFNHIKWHEYNCLLNHKKPYITSNQIDTKWEQNLTTLFQNKKLQLIEIPLNINHQKFKEELLNLL